MTTTTTDIAKLIRDGLAFRAGALRGKTVADSGPDLFAMGFGMLTPDWSRTLHARRHLITYVIYSYETPIAWLDLEAGWVMPDVDYTGGSMTGALAWHRHKIRHALRYLTISWLEA